MALFKKNQTGEGSGDSGDGSATGGQGPAFDPGKAERWFAHAKTSHESTNYEYATTCWLKGLAFDPANLEALQSFLNSAQAYAQGAKKAGPSKDQVKNVGGKTPVDKYMTSLLQWGTSQPLDAGAAVKATEHAASLGLTASARWIGEFALRSARGEAKPKKDTFVRLKDSMIKVDAYDIATKAAEDAVTIDPGDVVLKDEIRNLSAQAAMNTGGFENADEEGSFRQRIKNADEQQKIREQQQVVKTEDVAERVVSEAKADYESRPDDTHAAGKYVRALLERGTAADEQEARRVLKELYESTKEFRWRQQLGDLEIRIERRKVVAARKKLEESPGDESLKTEYQKIYSAFIEKEAQEYEARVEAYPTDTKFKYELGRRLYILGKYPEAIKHLQEAQEDSKLRTHVLHILGQAFEKLGWHAEAVDMLRQSVESHHSDSDELGMNLRYALLGALENQAKQDKNLDSAEEALKLASALAMKRIDYKDVVEKRQTLQQLIVALKNGG
ncbi:MAG: tetratricopeptide repeat protein [Phycisphaerales bacterium JB043]